MNTTDLEWQMKAACRDLDPNELDPIFFPPFHSDAIEAKRICMECPAMEACATFALDTGQEFGVWGCMTEKERKALLRRRWKQQNKRRKLEAAS